MLYWILEWLGEEWIDLAQQMAQRLSRLGAVMKILIP